MKKTSTLLIAVTFAASLAAPSFAISAGPIVDMPTSFPQAGAFETRERPSRSLFIYTGPKSGKTVTD